MFEENYHYILIPSFISDKDACGEVMNEQRKTDRRVDVCLTFDSSTIHAKNLKNQQGCNDMTIDLMQMHDFSCSDAPWQILSVLDQVDLLSLCQAI